MPSKSLARLLSKAGLCSRARAAALVREGRVTVAGRIVRDPERPVAPGADVRVDGRPLLAAAPLVVALHKPRGVVTTLSDERGRATVYDLLGDLPVWVSPVGRLDRDTTGLLLLTNDTALADRLTDPGHHVPRVYRARCRGDVGDEELARLRAGVVLADGPTRPADVRRLKGGARDTLLELVLTEGRNRQVRRMLTAVGSKVLSLRRVAIGPVPLGALPAGAWRALSPDEVAALRRACGDE